MLTPKIVLPDRELLQSVVVVLNREVSYEGAPDVSFRVNDSGTGIEFHLRIGTQSSVIPAKVTIEGPRVSIHLPQGQVASFQREDLLDHTRPLWNN